jgi:glutamate synthase (NADPH/NADH) large chain
MEQGQTLYDPHLICDACGFGLITQLDDQPSHQLVKRGIQSLANLTHRGARAVDGKTGDGCGIAIRKPTSFLKMIGKDLGFVLPERFAVGVLFLDRNDAEAGRTKIALAEILESQGLVVPGFRKVPIRPERLGEIARQSMPSIEQVFVYPNSEMDELAFERQLFIARKKAEKVISSFDPHFYIASLSAHALVYKGLMLPELLPEFYPDLEDERLLSSLVVFHQRFSTNTMPEWRLAQPFRYLAHNGEINTISGNRNWTKARQAIMQSPYLPELGALGPLVSTDSSDSASLDNMLEVLLMGGIDLFRALRMMIPPAWQNVETMDDDLRAFYEYHALLMEPWDGPAGIVLTDGRYAVCALDRNGLRPARYWVTDDRILTVCSESGVWDYDPISVVEKGRLKPGGILAADLQTGKILHTTDIEDQLKRAKPYRQWLEKHTIYLEGQFEEGSKITLPHALPIYEKAFAVSFEEKDTVIRALVEGGQEAVGSMGDDTPMAVLSQKIRSPYDYFRQQFAQVTNPPIDPIREVMVMSLTTTFARKSNPLEENLNVGKRIEVRSPILSDQKFKALLQLNDPVFQVAVLPMVFDPQQKRLKEALLDLQNQAITAVEEGAGLLVLSDESIDKNKVPIHALFATGAVHQVLVNRGLRLSANLIVSTATARDPHHFAALIGVGATAIHPYLAYRIIDNAVESGAFKAERLTSALRDYRKGINKGLLKIISKMGISTISSYRGAGLFEAVGMSKEVMELCFPSVPSRLGGADWQSFEEEATALIRDAFNAAVPAMQGGLLKYVHGGEYHAFHPDVVMQLQKVAASGVMDDYRQFATLVNDRPVAHLRDLFKLKRSLQPLAIEAVEPVENIIKRFDTAAMSLGALSPEAHEALAEAMNRLGARSNSGEGGEDVSRYGTSKMSKIKQVASGRFGVTPHYLVNAEVLQIKIAQGAKPGEGGQLPGDKVVGIIAKLRHAKEGVPLISPPPHHDIYSIEDLAQLIFDLKEINRDAFVSVKLVSKPGVGTIAVGVAKAYADLITISGYDGGTGASPISSIRYAGSPWELGLVETQQALRANGLRDRIRLQVDGGVKTGLDVVKAAILGAESFGFGTAPMIALGCKYLRICHLNNCATGVATQDWKLRKYHFHGLADMVVAYFTHLAEEVREWLAMLGVPTLNDLIGRTEFLEVLPGITAKQQKMNLAPLLSQGGVADEVAKYCIVDRNRPFDHGEFAQKVLEDCNSALTDGKAVNLRYTIRNVHRSIGARVSGEIAKRYGAEGLPDATITLTFTGTAGQSFGAWNAKGLKLILIGDANDYVGKGMGGGIIVIRPPQGTKIMPHEAVIMGNTCLYGATGGRLYASGVAGERFAVRNSGAYAVVEGVGDHGCEYMTGGCVVVLGETGFNFGAGMTGGFAFIYDPHHVFAERYNNELIDIHRIHTEQFEEYASFLHNLIGQHIHYTESPRGRLVFNHFHQELPRFWLVKPKAARLETLLKD